MRLRCVFPVLAALLASGNAFSTAVESELTKVSQFSPQEAVQPGNPGQTHSSKGLLRTTETADEDSEEERAAQPPGSIIAQMKWKIGKNKLMRAIRETIKDEVAIKEKASIFSTWNQQDKLKPDQVFALAIKEGLTPKEAAIRLRQYEKYLENPAAYHA